MTGAGPSREPATQEDRTRGRGGGGGGGDLGAVLYAGGLLLVVGVVADWLVGAWPFRLQAPEWRFAAFGLLSTFAVGLVLSGTLLVAGAWLRGHRARLRLLAVVAAVLALLLLGGIAAFVLDTVEVLQQVRPEQTQATQFRAGAAILKTAVAAVVFLVLSRAAWRRGRALAEASRTEGRRGSGRLVVGQADH